MIEIFSYITLAAGIAFFLWFKRKDWSKSALQPLHLRPGEQNLLTRGKDGYFSQSKSYIVNGLVIAVFTLAAIFIPWPYAPFLVGGMFFAWGLYVMDGIRKDVERLERDFARQRTILTNLKSGGNEVPNPKPQGYGKSVMWVSGSFYDFHVVPQVQIATGDAWTAEIFADQERAKGIITSRLVKLAQMPESDWFSLERSKSV